MKPMKWKSVVISIDFEGSEGAKTVIYYSFTTLHPFTTTGCASYSTTETWGAFGNECSPFLCLFCELWSNATRYSRAFEFVPHLLRNLIRCDCNKEYLILADLSVLCVLFCCVIPSCHTNYLHADVFVLHQHVGLHNLWNGLRQDRKDGIR